MNNPSPLAQLRDIQLPEIGGWWPPAPGWWILTLIGVIALLLALRHWRRQWQRPRWQRQALAELLELEADAEPSSHWFGAMNGLLKRAAREAFPERHPETLTGQSWAEFLLATTPTAREDADRVVPAMIKACWQRRPELTCSEALGFARAWLEARR